MNKKLPPSYELTPEQDEENIRRRRAHRFAINKSTKEYVEKLGRLKHAAGPSSIPDEHYSKVIISPLPKESK